MLNRLGHNVISEALAEVAPEADSPSVKILISYVIDFTRFFVRGVYPEASQARSFAPLRMTMLKDSLRMTGEGLTPE